MRAYSAANPDYAKRQADARRTRRVTDPAYRKARNESARNWYATLRAQVIEAYGGQCACCGESEERFLTIDHVDGGGEKHRREVGGSAGLYSWLRKQGFPAQGFQLLCFNCNQVKAIYGQCPHQSHPPSF